MPPASHFLKQSKNKMQAWVTSNGLAPNQASPAASGPGPGHDGHGQTNTLQRHVYLPQSPTQQPQTMQATQNSPPRSRAPIVNANSNRAATAAAARLPVPTGRTSYARDASLNMSRAGGVASEPIQPSRRHGPFWDGSTADGSMFSDTASNGDASTAVTSRYQMPFRGPTYQRGETPRPRIPMKQQETQAPPAQFLVGMNGMMDLGGGGPLTRSASTPDTRKQLNRLKNISTEPDFDQESEDGAYHTSPEKTPSAKRLHHTKPLPMHTLPTHTNRRGSFSERVTTYPNAYSQGENIVSSPQAQAYQNPHNDLDEAQLARPPHLRIKTQQESQPHRSTIFADTDTPMASHPDESDRESIEPEPTPKPAAKPKPQVSRKLFSSKGSKGGAPGLDESAMPRTLTEKKTNPKKRPLEQDYDDGALATMDYAELRNEAFDFDPAQEEAQSAINPPQGGLTKKLEHFQYKDTNNRLEFFTKMPVKDWEASGDWFLESFGEVMDRLRQARKSRRAIVEGFENEIAERGDAVRNKIQGIDKTLTEFKREGEGMMVGKEIE